MSIDDDVLRWISDTHAEMQSERRAMTVDLGDGVKRRGFIRSFHPTANSEYTLRIEFTEEKEV